MGQNAVVLEGYVAQDSTARFVESNKRYVVEFSVRVPRAGKPKAEGARPESDFFDVVWWQDQAPALVKGDSVVVVGRLKQERWEGSNKEKRSRVTVVASRVAKAIEAKTQPAPSTMFFEPGADDGEAPF